MYRQHIVVSVIVAVACMVAALPAFAMDAGQYAERAGSKFGRGVVNTATGWGEIPMQSYLGTKEDGVLGGVGGFFRGMGLGVARTLTGAFEIATFWAPVPEGFKPVMLPATVFDWPTHRAYAKAGSQTSSQ